MSKQELELDSLEDENQIEVIYPGVSDRIKAAVTDSFIIVILMFAITSLLSKFDNVPDNVRILAAVSLVLYDPIFTSLFGGTLGHMAMKIQIKRKDNPKKNIAFPAALIRYFVKLMLGWISLLTVGSNKNSMAIHDSVVSSIVTFRENG